MKKFYLLFAMAFCSVIAQAQTLFTYGDNAVSKEEFLRAYNKNKTVVTDKEKSLREYIELYSNFKLKVKEADELRIDTLAQIKYDIENFRRQVEENYMSDEKGMNVLMDEAYVRSQKDLHVIHFSAPVDEDSTKAYEGIKAIYDALKTGNNNYTQIIENNAAKYSKLKESDIGFITVFSVPYEYENIIYALKPGEFSKPYRSKKAWHIFKVVEERKAVGKWKVAQLLFTYPPNATQGAKDALQQKADSVYTLLKAGANFAATVKAYSDDKLTYLTAGEMPEFGTGKYDASFEKEVFKLTADDELSKPFETPFGIHIVKRLAHAAVPADKADAALQFELKQKIMQDSRVNTAKEKFAKEIINKIGFKRNEAVKESDLIRFADSVIKNPSTEIAKVYPISEKIIINFTKGSVNGADWLRFIREYKGNAEQYKGESYKELWNKYTIVASLDYYKKHMEEYNAEFRYQMQEFKEGNMLFEIMERNVWNMAGSDSTGLLQHYNANKTNYKWAASATVIIFNCSSAKAAEDALTALKSGKGWHEVIEANNTSLQADSGRYELTQIIGNNYTNTPVKNMYSTLVKNLDGTATFVKYLEIYPANQQRSFEEARGLVINDYQNVLEQRWLEKLHKKYPVKINEAVLQQMMK